MHNLKKNHKINAKVIQYEQNINSLNNDRIRSSAKLSHTGAPGKKKHH